MKRLGYRIIVICCSLLAVGFLSGSLLAQGRGNGNGGGGGGTGGDPPPNVGVGYRVFWRALPAGAHSPVFRDFKLWSDATTGQKYVLGVGLNYVSPYRAFVYDYSGFVDQEQVEKFYWIDDLIPTLPAWVPATHTESIFYSVNTSGRVVGVFRNPNDLTQNIPFFFDLKDLTHQLHQIPVPGFVSGPIGVRQRINELGDMLIPYDSATGAKEAFIFNPGDVNDSGDDEYVQLLDTNGAPLQFTGNPKFNSSREVAVVRADGTKIVRFPVGGSAADYEEFSNMPLYPYDPHLTTINEAGEFVCRTRVQKKRNQYENRATKIGSSVLWTAPVDSYPNDLNNSGDVLIQYSSLYGLDYYLLDEGDPNISGDEQLLNVRSMLISGTYPVGTFQGPNTNYSYSMYTLSDRDSTGFGWIEGSARIGTNPDGSELWGWFLLIPEVLP